MWRFSARVGSLLSLQEYEREGEMKEKMAPFVRADRSRVAGCEGVFLKCDAFDERFCE